jgi:amino acid permease
MEDNAPLIPKQPAPSDKWNKYTNSNFSERHLTDKTKKIRTSGTFSTLVNLIKMYVGVAFISGPKSIGQAGIYGALIGYALNTLTTIFCVYLLLKARNRFKRDEIIDICDLGAKLYGQGVKPFIQLLLVTTNAAFLMCYCMFLGFNADQLMCRTLKIAECHQNKTYTMIILVLIFPICCLRSLSNISYFSAVALFFTFAAIIMILIISA